MFEIWGFVLFWEFYATATQATPLLPLALKVYAALTLLRFVESQIGTVFLVELWISAVKFAVNIYANLITCEQPLLYFTEAYE